MSHLHFSLFFFFFFALFIYNSHPLTGFLPCFPLFLTFICLLSYHSYLFPSFCCPPALALCPVHHTAEQEALWGWPLTSVSQALYKQLIFSTSCLAEQEHRLFQFVYRADRFKFLCPCVYTACFSVCVFSYAGVSVCGSLPAVLLRTMQFVSLYKILCKSVSASE